MSATRVPKGVIRKRIKDKKMSQVKQNRRKQKSGIGRKKLRFLF
jgi:hypothetical protein